MFEETLFIVDGYNVIRNHPRYQKLRSKNLEVARVRLTEDLVDFAALTGARVFVVFDGSKGTSKKAQTTKCLGVEVWFSAKGETADQVIEKLAYQFRSESRKEGQIRVVTADYDLQKTVFQKGILRWNPKEMVDEMITLKEAVLPEPEKKREAVIEDQLEEKVKKALREFFKEEGEED